MNLKLHAIAGSLVATSLVALGGIAAPTAAVASPASGVRCPTGYTASFNGTTLTCTKRVVSDISNTAGRECDLDTPFRNFQRMALGQRDICVSQDIVIGSSDSLADFENGRVVIRIPVGRPLPARLAGRPVRVVGNFQVVQINANADFIFYDQSKTLAREVAKAKAKALIGERQDGIPAEDLQLGDATVRSTADAIGTLDRVEATIAISAYAKEL